MKVVEPVAYAMERRQLESIALLAEGRPVPWTAEAAPALWFVSLGVTAAAAAGYALRRRESLPLLGVAVAGGGCLLWQLMVQPPFAVAGVVDAALVPRWRPRAAQQGQAAAGREKYAPGSPAGRFGKRCTSSVGSSSGGTARQRLPCPSGESGKNWPR